MIKWFIVGAVIALLLSFAKGSQDTRECDGDCYTCEWYENGCKGSELNYEFYEEEDER